MPENEKVLRRVSIAGLLESLFGGLLIAFALWLATPATTSIATLAIAFALRSAFALGAIPPASAATASRTIGTIAIEAFSLGTVLTSATAASLIGTSVRTALVLFLRFLFDPE
jgi:hypothetical protein